MGKKQAELKNWIIHEAHSSYYNRNVMVVRGDVYNHPAFDDGQFIKSSEVVNLIDGTTLETLNTVYTLIGPGKSYLYDYKYINEEGEKIQ